MNKLKISAFLIVICFALSLIASVQSGPYYYPPIECVSEPNFNMDQYWMNTTSFYTDDGYAYTDDVNGWFRTWCYESGATDWADALGYQGWIVHNPWYASKTLGNGTKSARTMKAYPYIPIEDIDEGSEDGTIMLYAKLRHDYPTYTSGNPLLTGKALYPTTGACAMLFWNVWVNDTGNENNGGPYGPTWLFNYTDDDPWNEHNTYITEVFFSRWECLPSGWWSVPEDYYRHNYFTDMTTHDNDLHQIILPFDMDDCDTWYEFEYDIGYMLGGTSAYELEKHYADWGEFVPVHERNITVLGYQLMGIGVGNEVISAEWAVDYDYLTLEDNRNLTRQCEENGWITKTPSNTGAYYRPTPADGADATKNMTTLSILKYSDTNSSCDGDNNYDGVVDIYDTALISLKWGLNEGDDGWTYKADIKPDKTIDIFDLVMISVHYGENVLWKDPSGTDHYFYTHYDNTYGDIKLRNRDYWIDFPIVYNNSGLGSFKFEKSGNPLVVVIRFYENKNPSGTLNGSRFWSAINETVYPYS